MPGDASRRNGGSQAPLGSCPVPERLPHLPQSARVGSLPWLGLMVLESGRELVGLLENLFDASGHFPHLRYLVLGASGQLRGRSRTVVGVDDTDLVKVAGMVGADEHREPIVEFLDSDRVARAEPH